MKLTEKLNLTKGEYEILKHRLEASDSICETLGTDTEDFEEYNTQDVEVVIDHLSNDNLDKALNHSERITFEVLRECVEGSTYYAVTLSFNLSPQKQTASLRVGRSLAQKVADFIGVEHLEYPDY